jgi:hypothetical protein
MGLRRRVARRLAGDLLTRIDELEAEVQENRNLNLRVAELVDLVQELLIPVASQDRERIDAALAKFQRSL